MAQAATCDELKSAFQKHLEETKGHVTKLEQVFECFGIKAKGKTCKATVGLLEEGDEIAAEFAGSPAINAALIAAAQKVEHYEMASYGCLHEWAGMLGNKEAATLLSEILDEEKGANSALTALAITSSNVEALDKSNAEPTKAVKPSKEQTSTMKTRRYGKIEAGKIGWALLWLMGIPIPLLLVFFFLRGCT
jgi:ferritin-like metal-binding protein YciE